MRTCVRVRVCACMCMCRSPTNLMAAQMQQNGFEESLRPVVDITHFTPLSKN